MSVASRILARLAGLPPATDRDVKVERDLAAHMSDGVTLLADRWIPATGSMAPIVLLRSPYGRRQIGSIGRLFAERGYQAVIQSCRGTFGSGGEMDPIRQERDDGRDTLAWIADQPWFGGEVTLFGPSYLGVVQWAACDDPPEFVRALSPSVTAAGFRDSLVYPGGAFALESVLGWIHQVEHQERHPVAVLWSMLAARWQLPPGYSTLPLSAADQRVVGRRVRFYQDWLEHESPGDPWWEPLDYRPNLAQSPPATMLGGWYDLFLPAQLEDFAALTRAGRQARITIGPWKHASFRGMATSFRESLRWFDAHTGPGDGGDESGPPGGPGKVRLFVMGGERWVDLDAWPPPATVQRWHLHAGGRLDTPTPSDSVPDRYRFDPTDPTPSVGGHSIGRSAGRKGQRRREERSDVLCYTSAPMATDVTVAGPLRTDLYFRSSLAHTDVFVRLCVVSRSGESANLSDGILRLEPDLVTADEDGVLHLQVDMWPTAVTIRRSERIRLQVSSAAHPCFARNPGSGEPLASAMKLCIATQEVLHDPRHPSALELPISSI